MCCLAATTDKETLLVPRNGLEESGDARFNFTRVVQILEKTMKKPETHTARLAPVVDCSRIILVTPRNRKGSSFSWSRWCSWAHTAASYQYSCHLLQLFWSAMEVPAETLVLHRNNIGPA